MTRRRPLGRFGYQLRVYGGLVRANRAHSPGRDAVRASFPRIVQVQTIAACQAACVMCPYPVVKDRFPRGRMEGGLFAALAAEIGAHADEVEAFVPMLQNEPLLDRALWDRIRLFREATAGRVEVEVVTNGALLDDAAVQGIREVELDVLDISLDAVSRETYGRVRVGLDFDQVMAGVERVLAADLPRTAVFVRLVRTRGNVEEAEDFARTWRRRGVPVFVYDANNRGGALAEWEATQAIPPERVSAWARAGRRLVRAVMGHCPWPFATASILHDGQMLVCTHDWERREVLGNVRDGGIAAVWNGPRAREVRRLVAARRYEELPSCRDCSFPKDGWW